MTEAFDNETLHAFIAAYADKKGLENTKKAFSVIQDYKMLIKEQDEVDSYLLHCQSIARMLIMLDLPFAPAEEDDCIAATLLHMVSKHVESPTLRDELLARGIDSNICDILDLITMKKLPDDQARKDFYDRMKTNKDALLVRLAERSNMVERLSEVSVVKARFQIAETKRVFLPLCIYAKEKYPELVPQFGILLEKMRSLLDVSEILIDQFQEQEKSIGREILSLQEENSRIRTIIARLKAQA